MLLRPKALASDQTGIYKRNGANGRQLVKFRYRVEKVWERPVDFWLSHGLGLSPLSLLTDEAEGDLESALGRFEECLRDQHADGKLTETLLASSYVLCGLRYERERIIEMYRRLSMLMRESTTYQAILEEGQDRGVKLGLDQGVKLGLDQGVKLGLDQGVKQGQRKTVLRLGSRRFGSPSPEVVAALREITDESRLEQLTDRILDAKSWEDLLDVHCSNG